MATLKLVRSEPSDEMLASDAAFKQVRQRLAQTRGKTRETVARAIKFFTRAAVDNFYALKHNGDPYVPMSYMTRNVMAMMQQYVTAASSAKRKRLVDWLVRADLIQVLKKGTHTYVKVLMPEGLLISNEFVFFDWHLAGVSSEQFCGGASESSWPKGAEEAQ